MLVEMAIADAYGSRFEGAPALPEENTVTGYGFGGHGDTAVGRYTDDTQMALAVAETLLDDGPWTPDAFAARFVAAYQRDRREGYAKGFGQLLAEVRDGEELLARIKPASERSGAAMRAGPIGLLADRAEVRELAALQARITHDTAAGTAAAVASALLCHYFARRLGPRAEVGAFLASEVPGWAWSDPWNGWVDLSGIACVRAAVTAVAQSASRRELLWTCIGYGGDVDTVAAIAMAAASCSDEMAADLPPVLYDNLESGPYGLSYLDELDTRLTLRFPRGR